MGSDVDLKERVREHLDRAYGTGHWMVAVFRRDDEGVKINRVTEDFQTGDFLKCIELLAANLFIEQEVVRMGGTLASLPPLPRAKIDLPPDTVARMKAAPSQPVDQGCGTPPEPIVAVYGDPEFSPSDTERSDPENEGR